MKKRTKNRVFTGLAVFIGIAVLCMSGVAGAGNKYGYKNADEVNVTRGVDFIYCKAVSNNYRLTDSSIWRHLWYHQMNGNGQRCREQIDLTVDSTLNLYTEILLDNSRGDPFVLGPCAKDDCTTPLTTADMTEEEFAEKRATLNLSESNYDISRYSAVYLGIEKPTDKYCAIRDKMNGSLIQNLKIQGNNTIESSADDTDVKVDGVCIESNNIILHNVQVDDVAGACIVIDRTVNNLTFEGAFNKVSNCRGSGIVVEGPMDVGREINFDNIQIDKNSKPYLIKTEASAYVDVRAGHLTIIPSSDASGSRMWELGGTVKSCDTDVESSGGKRDEDCSEETATGVKINGLRIYAIDSVTGQMYLVKQINASDDTGEIVGGTANGSTPDTAGKFYFTLTEAEIESPSVTGSVIHDVPAGEAPEIFFMAIDEQDKFGSTSNIKVLSVLQAGDGGTVGGAGDVYQDGSGARLKVTTPSECDTKYNTYFQSLNFNVNLDTDGDGIKDLVEMKLKVNSQGKYYISKKADCYFGGVVSKWNDPDTDDDGIPDGKELRCFDGTPMTDSDVQKGIADRSNNKLCGIATTVTDVPVPVTINDADRKPYPDYNNDYVIMNTDGKRQGDTCPAGTICDFLPDVNDPNSDGDAKSDYEEDRAKLYRDLGRVAYFYEMGAPGAAPFTMPMHPEVEGIRCDGSAEGGLSSVTTGYDSVKGIYHDIYIIGNESEQPVRMTSSNLTGFSDGGYTIKTLACKSVALRASTNFDGEYAETGEDCANLYDASDKGVCKNTCVAGEILNAIADPAGIFFTDNSHTNLITAENSDVPLLFQKVLEGEMDADRLNDTYCGDVDQDGIPNCVEAVVANGAYSEINRCQDYIHLSDLGVALDTDVRETYPLSPYTGDSDGDGDREGWSNVTALSLDVCPTSPNSECDFYQETISRFPILAFYLDRDGDKLRDIYEFGAKRGDADSIKEAVESMQDQRGEANRSLGQSDPLNHDTDGDELSDELESRLGTNPTIEDSDDDGLSDFEEMNRDGDINTPSARVGSNYECGVYTIDTDPLKPDTDGDGLTDFQEVNLIGTNPNDVDSDQDGLCDGLPGNVPSDGGCTGWELLRVPTAVDSRLVSPETDPCKSNTDGDSWSDAEEFSRYGCGNNSNHDCVGKDPEEFLAEDIGSFTGELDTDGDGLSDIKEADIGTDPNLDDSDGDDLVDGCDPVDHTGELCNAVKDGVRKSIGSYFKKCSRPDFMDCDTDPLAVDSDTDGLSDKIERDYMTDPWNVDTDGDCIPDGPQVDETTGTVISLGEDKNQNGRKDPGETMARSELSTIFDPTRGEIEDMWAAIDTDDDGIPDGNSQEYQEFGCEDCNCNGQVDKGENGVPLETSALTKDTDRDGLDDWSEMAAGGYWNLSNLNHATSGRKTGCSMIPGAESADWGMIALFAGLLIGLGAARRKMTKENERA